MNHGPGIVPEVTIVVPTHNRCQKLMRLLRDLDVQEAPPSTEVIAVDDGSTDGTREAVAGLQVGYPLKYFRQECRGPAAARNTGIRQARGRFVILVDDDMRVGPRFIRAHLSAHATLGNAIVVGPGFLPADLPPTPFTRYRRRLDRSFAPAVESHGIARIEGLSSQNLSARAKFLRGLGAYSEDIVLPGGEEAELARRIRLSEVPIFFDAHIPAWQDDTPVTLAAYCAKHERYGRSSAEVLRKLPSIALEMLEIRANVRANGAISWRSDPASLIICKLGKRTLSSPPGLEILYLLVRMLEWCAPESIFLARLYRLMIGLHIFRGFRAGLANHRRPQGGIAGLRHAP